ncbi:MAG: dockerin type I repeat-containing protein [Oscillospiraceae bacterium]|nr:dockerin type I repeat-containing protein [Oscillospiraceae bacterium]
MKKKLLRSVLAMIAAGIISAAALPVCPVSAAYTRDDDSIQKRYPESWTDPDTGTVYYSNWLNTEGRYKPLFSTDTKPYSELTIVVPQDAATREELLAVCETYFDDSYQFEGVMYFSVKSGLNVQIYDPEARAETEQKCDQLFAALNEKYELVEFTYRMNIQAYKQHTYIDSWLCTYCYGDAVRGSTEDPQTGEKLTALIAEKYPDWEVRTITYETAETYSVRKKGCELYDVPAPEYLEIAYTIKKELGYQTGDAALAMDYHYAKAVKYYVHPIGDVNMDGNVDVTDAQLALQEYTAIVVAKGTGTLTDQQRKLADVFPHQYWEKVSCSNETEALMPDAQTILLYYAEGLADSNILYEGVDAWAETYYKDAQDLQAK